MEARPAVPLHSLFTLFFRLNNTALHTLEDIVKESSYFADFPITEILLVRTVSRRERRQILSSLDVDPLSISPNAQHEITGSSFLDSFRGFRILHLKIFIRPCEITNCEGKECTSAPRVEIKRSTPLWCCREASPLLSGHKVTPVVVTATHRHPCPLMAVATRRTQPKCDSWTQRVALPRIHCWFV